MQTEINEIQASGMTLDDRPRFLIDRGANNRITGLADQEVIDIGEEGFDMWGDLQASGRFVYNSALDITEGYINEDTADDSERTNETEDESYPSDGNEDTDFP